jgi:hypothetical protein
MVLNTILGCGFFVDFLIIGNLSPLLSLPNSRLWLEKNRLATLRNLHNSLIILHSNATYTRMRAIADIWHQ